MDPNEDIDKMWGNHKLLNHGDFTTRTIPWNTRAPNVGSVNHV